MIKSASSVEFPEIEKPEPEMRENKIIDLPSPNFGSRAANTPIDMLVVHYTGMVDAQSALKRLSDPVAKVSAHYCIDEGGTIYQLVGEEKRAWHAGISYWRGETDVNSRSLGIELVNPGHDHGYRAFPTAQMESLIGLSSQILARHPIPKRNVVGHSDIAPSRKQDPGELFDWQALASEGIGLWPSPLSETTHAPCNPDIMLADYGYETTATDSGTVSARAGTHSVVEAFQRHFRPSKIDGVMDEQSTRLLMTLLEVVA
jgi:N-acetylmuramoyl-L-alanine amidase